MKRFTPIFFILCLLVANAQFATAAGDHSSSDGGDGGSPFGFGGMCMGGFGGPFGGMGGMGMGMGGFGGGFGGGGGGGGGSDPNRKRADDITNAGKDTIKGIQDSPKEFGSSMNEMQNHFSEAVQNMKAPEDDKGIMGAISDNLAQIQAKQNEAPVGQVATDELVKSLKSQGETIVDTVKQAMQRFRPNGPAPQPTLAPPSVGEQIAGYLASRSPAGMFGPSSIPSPIAGLPERPALKGPSAALKSIRAAETFSQTPASLGESFSSGRAPH